MKEAMPGGGQENEADVVNKEINEVWEQIAGLMREKIALISSEDKKETYTRILEKEMSDRQSGSLADSLEAQDRLDLLADALGVDMARFDDKFEAIDYKDKQGLL